MEGTAQRTSAPAAPRTANSSGDANAQVQATLDSAGKILRAYGFDATANLAEEKARATRQNRSVVVVGEVKRGKSSLVNALLGWRDASPVDVDACTSTSISFSHATPDRPHGSAELLFPGKVEVIAHSDLADWVTVDGRWVRDPTVQSLPTRAAVAVNRSELGDTVIVDTPGVGGLDPSYAKLATHSAQQACVLVVVCDATTPMTAPEMAFIRDAAASVDSLVLAVTKTDKNIRRWRPIVENNRRVLQQHLNRSVPVVGVSCLRALAAAEMAPGPDRDSAERAAGITALRAEITRKLDMSEHLPGVDGLRTALEGLRKILDKVNTELKVAEGSETVLPDLTAELEKLQNWKNHSQQWEQYLQRDLTLVRQNVMSDLDKRLDEIKEKWTNRVNKNGMEVLRKNPQKFTAEMETDLQGAMGHALNLYLVDLHKIVDPLFRSEVVWNEIYRTVVASLQGGTIDTQKVASKRQGLFDPSMLTMGVMGSSMIAGLMGASVATLGIAPAVGAVWVGVNLGFRAMRSGKTNLLAWLRETIATTKTTTSRLLEGAMALSRPEIVVRYRDHVRVTMESLQKQINEVKESARLDAATREKSIKRLTNNQRVVTAKIAEAENLIARLTSTSGEK